MPDSTSATPVLTPYTNGNGALARAGAQTSEFWKANIGELAVFSAAMSSNYVAVQCTALLCFAWIITAYIRCRASVKGGM